MNPHRIELGPSMTRSESIEHARARSRDPNLYRATVKFKSWRVLEFHVEYERRGRRSPATADLILCKWQGLPVGIHHTALHAEIYAPHSKGTPVIRLVRKFFVAGNEHLSHEPVEWYFRLANEPVQFYFGKNEDGPEEPVNAKDLASSNDPLLRRFSRTPRPPDILFLMGQSYQAVAFIPSLQLNFNAISWNGTLAKVREKTIRERRRQLRLLSHSNCVKCY